MKTIVQRILILFAPLLLVDCSCSKRFMSYFRDNKEENVNFTKPPEYSPKDLQNAKLNSKVVPDYQTVTVNEIAIEDIANGAGERAVPGSRVGITYRAWYYDPKRIGNKGWEITGQGKGQGVPSKFQIGKGQVIQGIDKGVIGMRTGGIRRIIIPDRLAYGTRGVASIPGGVHLLIEIRMTHIEN